MSEYLSDQYVNTTIAAVGDAPVESAPTLKISATRQYAPIRFGRAVVKSLASTDPVRTTDIIRLFPVKSGDVPIRINTNSKAGWDASFKCDLGLATPGSNHTGGLIHANAVNLLANQIDIGSTLFRFPSLGIGGSLMNYDEDIGKAFWEIANDRVTGLSYTTDPLEEWDIIGTLTATAGPVNNGQVSFEMWYTRAVS